MPCCRWGATHALDAEPPQRGGLTGATHRAAGDGSHNWLCQWPAVDDAGPPGLNFQLRQREDVVTPTLLDILELPARQGHHRWGLDE